MTAAATSTLLAGSAALSAYLNAKYHISKDLSYLYYQHRGQRYQDQLKRQNKINIWATFTENATQFADRECIWYSDPSTNPPTPHAYTWREAHDWACRYAEWFLGAGRVRPGDCAGFYLQNSQHFMFAWMGLLAIGCFPAMINYNLVGGALVHCVELAECPLMLVDEEYSGRVLGNSELAALGVQVQVLDRPFEAQLATIKPRMPDAKYTKDANEKTKYALRYTSGTTGYPKAVMATTGRVYSRLAGQFSQMSIRPLKSAGTGDRWYICMPICHATAGSATLICMLMPVTLSIGKKFSASRFWSEVRASRSTVFTYVGEITRYLLALPPSPLDHQHSLRVGYGNGIRPDVWGRFQERFGVPEICEFYGSTEGGLSHMTLQKGDYLRNAVGHDGLIRRLQMRNAWVPVLVDAETNDIVRDPNTGLAIRMPYEVGGELLFRLESEASFVGYYKNREATEKKFARNIIRRGDLFYRSGDSLKRTPDGKWSFLDRLGDTFRWKGENVSTAEVSEVLGRYPGVIDANVYGVEVPNHDGRAGCAALLLDPQLAKNFEINPLLRHARADLPNFAVPLFLRIVPEAAMNATGVKQDKVQPRLEGVDPAKVRGDPLYVLRGDSYERFTAADWDSLSAARARL
ncbi:hypothetical protein B0A55_04388 [Friedmanniomyces simplex]|uniref:AMP-dependent synthetase/ligase domain-containing protein n=1 Tax=Friedmanniomyces simplex TaxID=329884 RepID=A0A4U0XM09_9PEZI|nr:hypothetical protein B0A55_04388 [Friedmanniomyces simplex]